MPLTWEELAKAHPLDFRMTNVIEMLTRSGDRWHNALKNKQNLELALSGKKPESANTPGRSAFKTVS
jgi:bifunctional non-homologous end joining protein LigD